MTEEAPPAPEPVQIVSLGGENGAVVTFHEEALQGILSKVPQDIKIAIVSVNGIFRSGKSFLLNFFLRYLLHGNSTNSSTAWMNGNGDVLVEGNANDSANGHMAGGFEWRGGTNRHTTGIWMWSEPFVRRDPASNEDIAILLMDTQGLHDTNTGRNANTFIFAVSTLLSSYQIYNVKSQIGEDHLGDLALFAAYAQYGRQVGAATNIKPFQRVEFLVRDWSNFENVNDDDMIREETEEYLSDIMRFRSDEGMQETRNKINQCFDEVDCFLLPHPGPNVAQRNFDGRIDDITDTFKQRLNCFVRHVFDESLHAKKIHGHYITAPELLGFFARYKSIYTCGDNLPEPMTILQATAEVNNRNAADSALKSYTVAMDKIAGAEAQCCEELNAKHKEAKKKALDEYDERARMGEQEEIDATRKKLNQSIEDKSQEYYQKNQQKAEASNKKAADSALKSYTVAMDKIAGAEAQCCEELNAKHKEAKKSAIASFDGAALGAKMKINATRIELEQWIKNKSQEYFGNNNIKAKDLAMKSYTDAMDVVAGSTCAYLNEADLQNCHNSACLAAGEKFDNLATVHSLKSVVSDTLQTLINAERVKYFEANRKKAPSLFINTVNYCTAVKASAENRLAGAMARVSELTVHNCNAVVEAIANKIWECMLPYLVWMVKKIALFAVAGVLLIVAIKAELIYASSILMLTAFSRLGVASIIVFMAYAVMHYCVCGYYVLKTHCKYLH